MPPEERPACRQPAAKADEDEHKVDTRYTGIPHARLVPPGSVGLRHVDAMEYLPRRGDDGQNTLKGREGGGGLLSYQ